jgi:hypothetical protein
MKRTIIACAAALMLASLPAAAQHGSTKWLDAGTIDAARELVANLSTWARSTVIPEARSWKEQLDGSLSAADLSKLNDLRRRAADLRTRSMALGRTMREAWKSEQYDALKKARADMAALKKERAVLLEELKPIAMASRATLEQIGERARPKIRQWADDARGIAERWWQANREKVSPEAARAIGRMLSRKQDLASLIEPKLRTKAAVARFMLWNGDDFTGELEGMVEEGVPDIR